MIVSRVAGIHSNAILRSISLSFGEEVLGKEIDIDSLHEQVLVLLRK
jgi:hypothetical protein